MLFRLPSALPGLRRLLLAGGLIALLVGSTGCSLFLRSTPVPIPTADRPFSPTGRTDTLVVFLPGRGDTLADYERAGVVTTLRAAGVKADAILVDAHLGYYYRETVIERLRADVLQPARARGYRRIVLVGISLGGLGAMLNQRDNPGAVDALVLLGPNLGDENKLFDRIAAAGGPVAWASGHDPAAGNVYEQLWTFLGTKASALPPVWLLAGRDDPYGRGQRLFATLRSGARVRFIPGAHDWPTWQKLWRDVCFGSDVFAAERTGSARPQN